MLSSFFSLFSWSTFNWRFSFSYCLISSSVTLKSRLRFTKKSGCMISFNLFFNFSCSFISDIVALSATIDYWSFVERPGGELDLLLLWPGTSPPSLIIDWLLPLSPLCFRACSWFIFSMRMLTFSDIRFKFSRKSLFSAFKYFFFLSFYKHTLKFKAVKTYVGKWF